MRLIGALFRLALWMVVLGIPLGGMWLASSMAALLNGPVWLTVLGGALLFPILPLAWDGYAAWRRRRRARRQQSNSFIDSLTTRKRVPSLAFADRLLLRTLLLNTVFLGVLLGRAPTTAANALTARGDWMLDSVDAPWAADAQALIFAIADRTDRLAEEKNTWADEGGPPPPPPDVEGDRATTRDAAENGTKAGTPITLTPVMPDGATGTISGTDHIVQDGVPLPLAPGSYEMIVMLADGRGIACPIPADWRGWQADEPTIGLVAGDPWYLGPEPCARFLAPDPTWRPSLHLVQVLEDGIRSPDALNHSPVGGAPQTVLIRSDLIGPEGIASVQIREPYVRLTLTEAASEVVCAQTDVRYVLSIAAITDGKIRYIAPVHEKLCDGVVRLPMTDEVAQRSGLKRAGSVTDQVTGDRSRWVQQAEPHPVVSQIPPELERSVQGVGRYIKSQIADPFERTRAVHDYVVTRVAYDVASLEPGRRAPQDADTVFTSGKGVCAGYANLMVAIGSAADLEVVYLIGHSRDEGGGVSGNMHAWNAVKLEGKWYLIDATWDAGSVDSDGFTADYKTDYLLTPPEIFGVTHFPDAEAWQLLDAPISRGTFTRMPMLRPSFFAADLSLVGIDRSQVTVRDALEFRIDNPSGKYLDVELKSEDGSRTECSVAHGSTAQVRCSFPAPGSYAVLLFHNDAEFGRYEYGGRILANVPG